MPKQTPGSIGEMMMEARNRLEIDARQQSYAAATEIVKNVITRYGNHEAVPLTDYWSAVAEGIFKKIKKDMDELTSRKQ